MKPIEAVAYVDGWDACIGGAERQDNPYRPPFGAWDKYRRDAWDKGWFHCNRGEKFHDPRPRNQRQERRTLNVALDKS